MSANVFRTPYSSSGGSMKNSLLSDRDQNLPLEACVGELIDNSFEWKAQNVWIEYEALTTDGWGRARKLAVLDDGAGMDPVKLVDHLTVGFHDAFGGDSSESVSKYGVGAKYAFFNTCRKSEVWSKKAGGEWYKAEFDFDDPYLNKTEAEWRQDWEAGTGNGYPKVAVQETPPAEHASLWENLESGTYIKWSNFDKKSAEVNGDEQLIWWLQRAFRNYIGDKIVTGIPADGGARVERTITENPNQRNIIFNGNALEAYDSLYAIPFRDGDGPEDHMGMEVPESLIFPFPIDDPVWVQRLGSRTAPIVVHFGLAPRAWRLKSGDGVWPKPTQSANLTENIVGRRIQGGSTQYGGSSFWDSRELVSLMRAGREVGRLTDRHLIGKRRDDTDRWMAITIEFGPELDSAFNVRNIKYQVKPTREVRTRIREEIKATVSSMHKEIVDWYARQKADEEARLAEEERERNRQRGPTPGEAPPRTPSAPEDWADDNTDTVGEVPDDPSQDSAEDLIERLFGSLTGFNRNEVLKEIARRKLTIETDLRTQVPADTEKMFEYRPSGGNVLKVKHQNHPYYSGLQSRYDKLMEIGIELSEQLEGSENEDLLASLNEITLLVKELEEIRDFGMNAAVIALARQSPRGEAVSFRDIFLREWGTICRQMMESKFNDNQE